MRLYLDQMFRAEFAEELRRARHDVLRASEAGQSRADDAEILERARTEARVLITLDEHFGDWTVLPLANHSGVVRLKAHPPLVPLLANCLIPFLARHRQTDPENHLVILSAHRARWIRTVE